MFGFIRESRRARAARRAYELAHLESLRAENARRLDVLRKANAECRLCVKAEWAATR